MSTCNTCARSFGFFNREQGCPRCKKIFCKKCLNHKIPESAENLRKMIYVCLRCSRIPLNDNSKPKKGKQEEIEDILKLSPKEKAFEPVLEPTLPSTSETDDIRSRLDALKKSDIPEDEIKNQNDDDIQKRLANLKGVEYKDYSASNKVLFSPDTRSEQEKIDDLLKQFVEEKNIDEIVQPESNKSEGTIDDIERRLAALRGQDLEKTKQQIEGFVETEEEETEKTMKQYIEEAKLEDIILDPDEEELISGIPPPPDGRKLDELPFCEICNEDASLRCLECENLFCVSCFKEFHDEEDYKTHKTKPYQAPKNNDIL
ncbi:CLUMA_CG018970, isoform A [Clunio marinus]|uniref:CLUMA_CG018970, isoform A n=1 Tax=Clunio marinus TaxID=568069 RepID=A0A1J1J0V0_9DIPT|nr:CLUMA_CG018970, isoform A [Clunio marinus]